MTWCSCHVGRHPYRTLATVYRCTTPASTSSSSHRATLAGGRSSLGKTAPLMALGEARKRPSSSALLIKPRSKSRASRVSCATVAEPQKVGFIVRIRAIMTDLTVLRCWWRSTQRPWEGLGGPTQRGSQVHFSWLFSAPEALGEGLEVKTYFTAAYFAGSALCGCGCEAGAG